MKLLLWISSLATVVIVGFVITGFPAEAHHSSAPFYDDSKSVEVIGTVLRFNFRNPHSFVFILGENEDGEMVEWEVEMGAAISMSRRGWTPESIILFVVVDEGHVLGIVKEVQLRAFDGVEEPYSPI